ncbi:hypothetical protein EFV37_32535 [Mesorhizobium loti]|uniref:hypothetical protein n=1 Tax=Mesorhizobium TaxID=68287 RepID=UPI0003806C0D|nr:MULTISPECIES: hypothetical protein [Mesorhizobium]ANN60837.1 hypothetical protein A9174_31830 [Mesorhizobium loti NZP2037]OBP75032.1 hypothetical protein BAE41_31405 [Mesorhizobium loti]OBP92667.1 hypothetical protein BAE38_31405 [Mesorhizobium loti]OBQ66473.1 hypothetical protein A9K72_34735 [Mesorhizobium loti]QKC66423.1 hypothetical protein EB229_32525 [Mesorhizobium jarvisii]
MTTDTPLTRYSATNGALASGFVTAELHLYGAMIVKLAPGSFPHLLVRPIGDHLLVPTWLRTGRRAQ